MLRLGLVLLLALVVVSASNKNMIQDFEQEHGGIALWEPSQVKSLLTSLHVPAEAVDTLFAAGIDGTMLISLSDQDLKELGVKVRHVWGPAFLSVGLNGCASFSAVSFLLLCGPKLEQLAGVIKCRAIIKDLRDHFEPVSGGPKSPTDFMLLNPMKQPHRCGRPGVKTSAIWFAVLCRAACLLLL